MKWLLISAVVLFACADNKEIAGREVETFGLLNQRNLEDTAIVYSLSWGNVIWGCVLAETVVAPLYFFGFSLWEPESLKVAAKLKPGIIPQTKEPR